jgi:ABC-type oligopeptide transport system substrate-binding subunit
MRIFKAIMIMAVLAGALSLGACAKKESMATTTTSAGTTRSYSK